MLTGLRGLVQPALRGLARLQVGGIEAGYRIKEWFQTKLYDELYTDYDKFARQDFITSEIPGLNQDYLIPGHLHEESVWALKQKYRYEVATPYETAEGERTDLYTTITANERLTPNEVFDLAAEHPSVYLPEGSEQVGDMAIEGVWYRE